MARNRRNNQRGRTSKVQDVRIMDDYAGQDGAKFDRVISQLQNSHSQTRIMCTSAFGQATQTTGGDTGLVWSGVNVRASDEFVAMATQFQTYRITMIRFDIYDVAPNTGVYAEFSTFHDVAPNYPTPTFAQVIDAPDSQNVPPGQGKLTLIWRAKGTLENQFQSTGNLVTSSPSDFGGLRGAYGVATVAGSKYWIIAKAVVDFRGRI